MVSSFVSYAVAAGTYGLTALLLAASWRHGRKEASLLAATVVTALWAGLRCAAALHPDLPQSALILSELARSAAWIILLLMLLHSFVESDRPSRLWHSAQFVATSVLLVFGIGGLAFAVAVPAAWDAAMAVDLAVLLCLSIVGLMAIENLFSVTRGDAQWTFKHLLIGLGCLFAYDLFLYSEALLFRHAASVTADARPLVNALIAPLLLVSAARIRSFSFKVSVSRRAVLHSTTLVGSGVYLLSVAAIGYLLQEADIEWGPPLQVAFLIGALLLLAALLSSGELRARLKMLIAQNFFAFAYDYREEWLRFIRTMSDADLAAGRYVRAIRALTDVLECSGGALFLRGRSDIYPLAARWNWGGEADLLALPASLAARLERTRQVINLRDDLDLGSDEDADAVLAWVRQLDKPWLLVPLRARDQMLGAMLLAQPRAPRALTWEDKDLLDILGLQVGSYIAEEQATQALIEAQRFERLSRNFSFVAHDLKNLVSQLSLIVQHAERHGGNPEFQRDVLATVGHSVEKMRAMLVRLRERTESDQGAEVVDLVAIMRELVERKRFVHANLYFSAAEPSLEADVDRMGIAAVMENLLQNAIEAAGPAGHIQIGCRATPAEALVEVSDDGPGMSADFIQTELFQPFASTKSGGFGIGMYQSRELVERWGGRLEIDSAEASGTAVRIVLPLARPAAPQPPAPVLETPVREEEVGN